MPYYYSTYIFKTTLNSCIPTFEHILNKQEEKIQLSLIVKT